MSLGDIFRGAAVLGAAIASVAPHYARAIEHQKKVDERACYIQRERPLAHDVAARVAAFVLGGWTERYLVAPYDIGEDAALFVADHLVAHVTDTTDAMHEALEMWRAEEGAGRLGATAAATTTRSTRTTTGCTRRRTSGVRCASPTGWA